MNNYIPVSSIVETAALEKMLQMFSRIPIQQAKNLAKTLTPES